ncbi:hypothetical protein [Bradyrhizobium sp. CCBAU 11361]|uniref:hypothetical protein n=1 Tax=Bradyrhizobium sp. CCBAU 11361 TaxID=1630812 RepID=UPI00230261B2|nr:hypothetical protein [Bradyrhizobium sp. CCBAU 11361]
MAFTQIGHAFFAKDGVQLAFGRRWDGELVHISQVEWGAACGCTCPAQDRKRKLISRKPESDIAHHFSHARLTEAERKAGVSPNCRYAPMTILHAYAEKLLNHRKALVLPPVAGSYGKRRRTKRVAKEYSFDAAKLEAMDGETIPDVILYRGEQRMHVEVFVTHRCDEEKRAKIIAAEIAAIEIDLSGVDRNANFATVNDAILNSAPREWIYNRRVQDIVNELHAEADAEAEASKKRRQKAVADLASAYARANKQALAADWKNAEDVAKITEAGDAILLGGSASGGGYFTVHPRVWKAAVLNLLHERFGNSSPGSMVANFSRRGWLVTHFRGLEHDEDSLTEEAGLPPGGPQQAIESFLRHLARKGIAADEGWRWGYTHKHSNELDNRAREKQRLAREESERSSRRGRLASMAKDIVAAGNPDSAEKFDLNIWLVRPLGSTGKTAHQIAEVGDTTWHELIKGLKTTLAVLKDDSEDKAEDFGLPVSDALHAMRAVHEARIAQRKSEAEEKERQERQARIDTLMQEARRKLGDESEAWLDRPFKRLGDMTPRQAAAESASKLDTARWILDQVLAARVVRDKWVEELECEATGLLRRVETDSERLKTKVTLYMSAGDPNLPNRISPKAYTRNEVTMHECLALLKQRIGKR